MALQTKVLIPEFPIRLGSVRSELEGSRSQNRSYKVDFYVRSEDGQNIFIEFKSDILSRRDEQDDYLQKSAVSGMLPIIQGILKLFEATEQKQKYEHLLAKLELGTLVDIDRRVLINDEAIRIIYIQPRRTESDSQKEVMDFNDLSRSIRDCYPNENILSRFAAALDAWAS